MARAVLPAAASGPLTLRQVARGRQAALLLADRPGASFADVAEWLGALQAQDLASAQWSFGIRVPGSTESDVVAAFERGEILRTWPMRGTIHAVPSGDVRWMLNLTGVRSLAASETRRGQLGFDRSVADRACSVLEAALKDEPVLARPSALARLAEEGIDTSGQRGYHLLWYAAVSGLTCIGPQVGKQQSVVLLDQWAPRQRALSDVDAMTELAWRYFRSHGPATEADFAGWTGLPLTAVRAGIAANAGRLVSTQVDGSPMILSAELADAIERGATRRVPTRALPGFDEFVLGYKDRRAQLPAARFDAVVPGGNGVFRNTICVEAQVVGTWQRTIRTRHVDVTVTPFEPTRRRPGLQRALAEFGRFVGRDVVVSGG